MALASLGLEAVYERPAGAWCGFDVRYEGDRVFVDRVFLDGPGMQAGVNAGDEIITIAGLRILRSQWESQRDWMRPSGHYEMIINRHGQLLQLGINPTQTLRQIKEIKVLAEDQVKRSLGL